MWDIYYIYWVSSGYIQQYSRLDQGFFVLCRIPRAARRALRPSALGHGVPPSGFDIGRKNLGLGAILLYIALRDPIYTLHIYHLYAL